ncbi:MAG: VOC family protein, partial [Gemmatimonadales bacterium]
MIPPPEYRLPDRTRLGTVRLQVADLKRSLDYYEKVIGFRILGRASGMCTLGAHGDDTPLLELHERPGAAPVPSRGRLGLYHFAILLPSRSALGSFLDHLEETGVRAGMSDHLVSESIYLTDPDGLGIEVYADRPRNTWQHNGDQIAMATIPLNARNLIAAAEGERWTGLPGGTAIGHVHLFVADLDMAARFYHNSLGFDKTVWSYPGALFMSAGGYHHHLGTNTWAAGAAPAREDEARLLEWSIMVPGDNDVVAAAESILAAGFQISRDDGDV